MCHQSSYHHNCGHITTHSPKITCEIPSGHGHVTWQVISPTHDPCPTCSGRGLPLLRTNIGVSLFVSAIPWQGFSYTPSSVAYPSAPPPPYSWTYVAPRNSTYLTGIIPPGNVPASVPREVRHELIRGVLTPVEHFRGTDIGMASVRGYNYHHGFDTGFQQLGVGNEGWNPIHGFDQGPPPPNFAPGGPNAPGLAPPQTAGIQPNVEDAAQRAAAAAAADASGAEDEGASREEKSGSEPAASGNGGESASDDTSGSERKAAQSASSSSTPNVESTGSSTPKSALKKWKEGGASQESSSAEGNDEGSSTP